MVGTLPSPESAALRKPLVAVIGDSEDMLAAIGSCKDRLEFVRLNAIPEEPNFWSVRQISGRGSLRAQLVYAIPRNQAFR
jgi:hypothetical protein